VGVRIVPFADKNSITPITKLEDRGDNSNNNIRGTVEVSLTFNYRDCCKIFNSESVFNRGKYLLLILMRLSIEVSETLNNEISARNIPWPFKHANYAGNKKSSE